MHHLRRPDSLPALAAAHLALATLTTRDLISSNETQKCVEYHDKASLSMPATLDKVGQAWVHDNADHGGGVYKITPGSETPPSVIFRIGLHAATQNVFTVTTEKGHKSYWLNQGDICRADLDFSSLTAATVAEVLGPSGI